MERGGKMIKKWLLVLVAITFAASAFAAKDKNSIQIKGSDTMVNLGQAWAEKYMEKNPHDFAAVTGGGSGTGLSSLISGTCDIAMSSRNIKEKEIAIAKQKGINPNEIKVALDGLAVVVNPGNSISKLTLAQLADIFTGRVTDWKEVGGKDGKIVIHKIDCINIHSYDLSKALDVKFLDSVICNKCGYVMGGKDQPDLEEWMFEHMHHMKAEFGYASEYDGQSWHFDICNKCKKCANN